MANQNEKKLAYEAGRAAITEPSSRLSPEACPFPEGSDERVEWLQGLSDAMDEQPNPADIKKALKEAKA